MEASGGDSLCSPTEKEQQQNRLEDEGDLMYEIQFFEFSPRALIDTIFNVYVDKMGALIDGMKTKLLEGDLEKVSKGEVERKTEVVKQQTESFLTHGFDKMEKVLITELFHIPSFVLLPEDSIHGDEILSKVDAETERRLDEAIYKREGKLLWFKDAVEMLRSQVELQDKIIKKFNPVLERCQKEVDETERLLAAMRADDSDHEESNSP